MNEDFEIKECRSCGSKNLISIISLGNQYVTNFINSERDQVNIPKVPLDLVLCENCKLLQLKHNAPPESMWGEQYWYKSGISSTIKNDLKDIVDKSNKIIKLNRGDIVIDIGCNDGTLLSFYDKNKNANLVGFEPSKNVAKEAASKGFDVINDFFNAGKFEEKFGNRKAKIITAISMFYDLENPNKFLNDIVSILDKEGLFVIQQNYLLTMLQSNAFDNICHEHREYYSLLSLKKILNNHGLDIFDVEFNDINGGSIRTYICHKEKKDNFSNNESMKRIKETEDREKGAKLESKEAYTQFSERIKKIKNELMSFLRKEREKGKKIWIYGASTRGNVSLQYFDIDKSLIDKIADKNQDKWGKKTVGTLIPITSPEEMRKANPDYILVMVWHFFNEVKEQEKDWFENGGEFIVPMPQFRVVKFSR